MSILSTADAERYYDRCGSRQDDQGFYEAPALDILVDHGAFETAQAVVEFGCGTGQFAHRLLRDHLGPTARYWGFDLSTTMVKLAQARLKPYGERVRVLKTDGGPRLPLVDRSCDCFVSTFVLDLLPESTLVEVLQEAQRLLQPGGLLCLAGITPGVGVLSTVVMRAWAMIHTLNPSWVGGCRPLKLEPYLDRGVWRLRHRQGIAASGIAVEGLVAELLW